MQSIIMLSVVMLSVVKLNVVMLNVVAPEREKSFFLPDPHLSGIPVESIQNPPFTEYFLIVMTKGINQGILQGEVSLYH